MVVKVGKFVVLATLLSLACASFVEAAPRGTAVAMIKQAIKAPRTDGGTEVPCACSSTAELAAIRNCICYIRSLLGDAANDTVVQCLTTLEQINEADISVISWLKTIYAADLGWAAVPCNEQL